MSDFNYSKSQEGSSSVPSLMANRSLFSTVLSIGIVFGTGIGYGYREIADGSAIEPSTSVTPHCSGSIYDSIHLGMTLTDVRAILNNRGREIQQSHTTAVVEWHLPCGQTISGVFQANELIEKKQLAPDRQTLSET